MNRRTSREARAGRAALLILVAGASALAARSNETEAAYDAGGVPWRTDLGSAQVEAKEKDLVLWLQFTGPWCPNCRRMERGAFVHGTVVGVSRERFVPIKLRSDEFEGLAVNLGLSVLPSTVLVRPNGEVIGKLEGYADPTEFYAFLQDALVKEGRVGGAKVAANKPASPAAPVRPGSPSPSRVALASYCPVSLVDGHKLVPGKPDVAVQYGGKEYRFADSAARAEFLRQPDRFVPVNDGASPVCQVDGGDCRPGDPRWGVTYKGRLYLCADVGERDLFLLNPERYSHVGEDDRAKIGDRRGLWALIRPSRYVAPTLPAPIRSEPLAIQALRAPFDAVRR